MKLIYISMPQFFYLRLRKKSELDPGITKKANASAGDVGGVHLYWPIDID